MNYLSIYFLLWMRMLHKSFPANIYLSKVSIKNIRKKRGKYYVQWRHSGALLLILNKFHSFS